MDTVDIFAPVRFAGGDEWIESMMRDGPDKLVALSRVFGRAPRLGSSTGPPPPIGVGEITSSARRDTGALELISRFRERAARNAPPRAGGLAWYTPSGLVRYAVVAPDQQSIQWLGNLGRIPGLAAMNTDQREQAIRALVAQASNQPMQNLPAGHAGPDLVPVVDPFLPAARFDGFDGADDEGLERFHRILAVLPSRARPGQGPLLRVGGRALGDAEARRRLLGHPHGVFLDGASRQQARQWAQRLAARLGGTVREDAPHGAGRRHLHVQFPGGASSGHIFYGRPPSGEFFEPAW